jgi:hypothetical protein
MELAVTKPAVAEHQASVQIQRIDVHPKDRVAHVSYTEDGVKNVVVVDVQPILDAATQTQRDTIALFFRAIIANVFGITPGEVPDAVWL